MSFKTLPAAKIVKLIQKMPRNLIFCFVFVLFSLSLGNKKTSQYSYVEHLTKATIKNKAYDRPAVVMFFAPWCPFSKGFRPTFEEFAKLMRGKMLVGDVDE